MRLFIFLLLLDLASLGLHAQSTTQKAGNLSKIISVQFKQQRLEEVLNRVSKKGGFFFSYNGNIFNGDSIVTISVQGITVRELLDRLFKGNVDYKEAGNYIILRSTVKRFSIVPHSIISTNKMYVIEGEIVDQVNGEKIENVSVYEKQLLQSTLTDREGNFRLRFRGNHQSVILTASKEAYRDTAMLFLSNVNVGSKGYVSDEGEQTGSGSNLVERSGLGRLLVSSRQRIQSLNIPGFIANSPFQASLLPGLSSHGMLSSQVINRGSLNLLGGYTAGVDGIEVAGLFNINKNNMQKLQVGGLFNIVGGQVRGVQVAGVLNTVLDSVIGVQVGGVANDVRGSFRGTQVGGVVNHVKNDIDGIQVAGVSNFTNGNTRGVQVSGVFNVAARQGKAVQVAGVGNVSAKSFRGVQIGAIFNYARHMDGVQVGLINLADSSSGYSLGLINLVRKGYHKLAISSNEVMNTNISIKTGNTRLYSILLGGMNFSDNEKVSSAGYGLGREFNHLRRLSATIEASSQFLYLGNWETANILSKLNLNLQFRLVKGVRVFAGPSFSVYYSEPSSVSAAGYKSRVAPRNHWQYNSSVKTWMGWNAGVIVF